MISFSFSCETSRRRLIEALEAYTIIESPYAHTAEQVAGAQRCQTSHAQEMEAVRLTLLLRGAEDDEFYYELASVTPDQVIVEMHQENTENRFLVKLFNDEPARNLH